MKSLVAVVSFAAALLLAAACGGDPTGTPVGNSTATGKIAFIAGDDDGTGFYIVNADGTGLTRLHNIPRQGHSYSGASAAWSPDGSRIALIPRGNNGLSVINADGTGETRLADFGVLPAWSPDGTSIAFVSGNPRNIHVIHADGSGLTRITDIPATANLAWSPDGSRIAFVSDSGGNFNVYVMNADGSGLTNLTKSPAEAGQTVLNGLGGFAWSPDGSRIAFDSATISEGDYGGNSEIYVINIDGTGLTRLTNGKAPDTCPAWSPDGQHIAFSRGRSGLLDLAYDRSDIWIMSADGSDQARIVKNGGGRCPLWLPAP